MRILITGGKGMLGRTLQRELAEHELIVADLPEWDVTDETALVAGTCGARPDVVIHCAAMTKVDDCETKRELAFRLNEEGSRNVARACKAAGARLIAISTDYVFSGEPPTTPWDWSETDEPRPRTTYGASKYAGERAIMEVLPEATVLRIAWLYGAGGPSFVHTMVKLGASEGPALKVVDDQCGNPTSTKAVAGVIRFLLGKPDVSGVVHGTCEGTCTWCEFAREIRAQVNALAARGGLKEGIPGFLREIAPCTTEEYPRPAPRPHVSSLKKGVLALLGYATENWKAALQEFVAAEFGR